MTLQFASYRKETCVNIVQVERMKIDYLRTEDIISDIHGLFNDIQ